MTEPNTSIAADDLQRPTFIRWRMILILCGFTGLNHFHRQSLPAVVDNVMHDCRFSATDMGWVYSAFLLGYVTFMIPGGWLSDRRGGWFALVLSGFGTAGLVAATGLCGYNVATGAAFASILVVRFWMGVLTAPLFPAAGRIVAAWVPFGTRAWANGLVLGATTIGVSAAPIVFGALSDRVGWQTASLMTGGVTALLAGVWAWDGRNTPAEHSAVNPAELAIIGPASEAAARPLDVSAFVTLLRNPSLLLLTLNYVAVGYYEYTLFYWMKYYFSDVLHYTEQTSRYYTSIVTFAMVFAMPLGGILSDRLVGLWGYRAGRAGVPILGMLASAALLFAATQAREPTVVVSRLFMAHAAIGLCEAPTWVAGLEIGGDNCGTSAAIVNTGGNLGGLLAPVVTVYVAQQYGWNAGFFVASLACLAGVVLWLGIRLEHPDSQMKQDRQPSS
jgi:ACS family glucarate transporter-like MFS transporter